MTVYLWLRFLDLAHRHVFGLLLRNRMETWLFLLEVALMECEIVNCHPLVNTLTTSIAAVDLLRFLEATGHPPRIVALSQAPRGAVECGS